ASWANAPAARPTGQCDQPADHRRPAGLTDLDLTNLIPQNDPVDVALDLAGAVGQGQAVEDGLVVAFEPGEGAQVRLVAGAGLGDPGIELLAAPAGEDLGEFGDVRGEGVQVRALGADAGEAGLCIVVQGGGVAQDPAGDVADLGRRVAARQADPARI